MSDKYDAATEKRIVKTEKKDELLTLGKDSIKENKARHAAEKAEEKAAKLAAKNAPKPEVIYDDFTELFDKEAYDAEKAAEAQAIADAKAAVEAAKAEKRAEKVEKKEAKLVASYEKAVAAELDATEREKEMDTFRKQLTAEAKARAKAEKAQAEAERLAKKNAPKPEVIYDDFTELFDKEAYDAEKAAEAKAIADAKAAAIEAKAEKRAEKAAKVEAKISDKYDAATEKKVDKLERRDELLTLGKESIKENKERHAAEKAEAKAERAEEKAARLAEKNAKPEVVYPDFTELFDKEAYDAEKAAEAKAIADAKAAEEAAKAEKRAEKAAKVEAKISDKYDKVTAKRVEKNEKKDELQTLGKESIKENKELKEAAKAKAEAERLAKSKKPEVEYPDFTELFDSETYYAEKKAIADAEAKAKADAKEAKDLAIINEALEEIAKEDEMDALRKQYKAEAKARAKAEKARAEADKLATLGATKPVGVYSDFTEIFDKEAYDAEKKAIIEADAAVKAAEEAERAAKRAEKVAKVENDLIFEYTEATDKKIHKAELKSELKTLGNESIKENKELKEAAKAKAEAERLAKSKKPEVEYPDFTELFDSETYYAEKKAIADAEAKAKADAKEAKDLAVINEALEEIAKEDEMDALRKQYKAEAKARVKAEKAQAEAERLAKITAANPEGVYVDFTELFDKEAYDAEKAAEAQRVADAKAAVAEAKAEKRAEKAAKAEAEMVYDYTEATDKKIHKAELKEELKTIGNESLNEDKARRAAERAEAKAERLAKKNAPKPEVIYNDFTELFDREAYDAEKAAEAKAVADAKAAVAEAKAEKRAEKAAAAEERMAGRYDAATEKHIEKLERKAELKVLGNDSIKENKERRAAEKAEAKAERLAVKNAPKPEVIYDDFTELFDKEAYDAEKAAEAKAVADAKAALEAAKAEKRAEKAEKKEAKEVAIYEKATAEERDASEREKEMDSFRKQYNAEAKARAKDEKEKAKAEKLAKANAPKPEVLYPDPELVFNAVDAETNSLIDTAPEDLLEGYRPKVVSVADLVRAAKEDKKLTLLIKKDKGIAKRVQRDLETLELAEKFVDNGALEMADTATVVRDAKQADKEAKEKRLVKEYNEEVAKNLEAEEKIQLAEEYKMTLARNKKRAKRAKKYGKFMLEYGSTYDPEWDGEFNNYGLPEVHPYTEGVKLSKSRRRTAKKERLSHFNKDKLTALSREQCNTDLKMIEARVEYNRTALELEVAKFEQDFSGEFKGQKEKRWFRDNRNKLKGMKHKLASALKFEKLDNERYYSVVATDFDRVNLHAKADREELVGMREELMRLLDIRDEINTELFELYSGTENGMKGSTKGRAKVTLRARKRAHAGYVRNFRVLNKRRVTRNEKMRIFDKMDEVVERKGDIARLSYILRKEKPSGKVRRDYVKELKSAKRDVRILKKSVERSTIKALRRARKREIRMWTMIASYSLLILLALFVLSMVTMGPEILRASKLLLPENLHQYIDQILSNWPL